MTRIRCWDFVLIVALICAASLFAQNAPAPSQNTDLWEPLRFLIGTWEAKTQGGSAGAVSAGAYSFQLELRNHVLVRKNERYSFA